jgi:hypothetical protein
MVKVFIGSEEIVSGRSYNQGVKGLTIAVASMGVSIALLSGCKKDIQNNDAVKQGVMNYLSKRPDLLTMDVSVTSVAYRKDDATALVHFQAKGASSAATGMDMQYVLERKNNEWVVKGRAGNSPHGTESTGLPQGVPPSPNGGGSIGAMPNTRPPSGALPPGHPPIKPGQKK